MQVRLIQIDMDGRKAHLAKKLVSLLAESGQSQTELARFCGVAQGLIADHIREKAFPKIDLLIAYSDFFTKHLGREITLFELTGIEALKGYTKKPEISSAAKEAGSIFEQIPDDDPLKQTILYLLEQAKKRKRE